MLPRKQPHTEHTLYATQCRRHVQHTVVFRVKCPVPSSNHVVCYNVFARYTSRRNRSRPERENQRGRSSSPPARVDPRWRQRILSHQHSWLSTSQGKALCLCLAHSAIDCRPRACGKVNPSVSKPWRHLTTELGGAQRLTARSGRFMFSFTYYVGVWVEPRTDLNAVKKRKMSADARIGRKSSGQTCLCQ